MMWAYDLSETLGWAASGGPRGSWLAHSTRSPWQVRMSCLQCVNKAGLRSSQDNPKEV